jgi:hypothetical protein
MLCLLIPAWMLFSCETQESLPVSDGKDVTFIAFSTKGQTLPTFINIPQKQIRLEVGHDVDITRLVPEFSVPDGYTAYVNGEQQVSGQSVVDFSQPVSYELRNNNNQTTTWQMSAVPLHCKILVDASHDGGVWWFPQSPQTGFNAKEWHQGKPFADMLREKGFEVTELGRGIELSDEMFYGHYIVIRAAGFSPYTEKELQVYSRLLERGMNLVLFTDHKTHDLKDELEDHLGIKFEGAAVGKVTKFASHQITKNMSPFEYVAGSVLTNADQNHSIEILGWLGEDDFADLNFNGVRDENEPLAPPVMGVLYYPNSRIFFIGDLNGLETQPQPFIDNLIQWMGTCFVY